MANKATTFLMFEGRAEEAMNFYVSLFDNAEVLSVEHYKAGEQGAEGSVKRADFTICGQNFTCIDSPAKHNFTFTPAISIFIECESEAELDDLYAKLSDSGQLFMPLGNYGFSAKFGWVGDRFGVSWQLNLQ